jgi:glycerophosphoryl diester phosphodiesterase
MGPHAIACARVCSLSGRIPRLGARCIQIPERQGRVRMADPVMIRAAHRSGLPVHIWTIDDDAEMERLLDMGVDGIMSDRIEILRDVLRARGAWHEVPATP